MRLQKYLASCGVASRRACEQLISDGRVKVNGLAAALGCIIDPEKDAVTLDGNIVKAESKKVVIAFYKPMNVVCTSYDPQGRDTVIDYFKDYEYRLFSAGRLDFDSEGLLLLTNDGDLAYRITHPKFVLDKTYYAICSGILTEADKQKLTQGVLLEDGLTSPAKVNNVQVAGNKKTTSFTITIHEGRNRQVRRMIAALGHDTLALRRIAVGPIKLGELAPGRFRSLAPDELNSLEFELSQKKSDFKK